jgi:hypothetical protein
MNVGLVDLKIRQHKELMVFWSLCALFGVLVILKYRHETAFFADDWTIFGSRLEQWERFGFDDFVLRRHNEHLMGGMVLWDVGLAKIFGLHNYLPWLISVQIANSFVCWVLFRYMTRIGTAGLVAAVVSPFFMIWAPLNSNSYWAPEAIFSISLACIMLHFSYLVLKPTSNKTLILGSLIALIGIFVHSICAVLIPISVMVLLVQKRWRSAFIASLPLAMYGLWFLTYQNLPTANRWMATSESAVSQKRDFQLFFSFSEKILSRTIWLHSSTLLALLFVAFVSIGFCICFRRGKEKRLIAICAIIAAGIFLFGFFWSRAYAFEIFNWDPPGRYAGVILMLLFPLAIVPVTTVGHWMQASLVLPQNIRYAIAVSGICIALLINSFHRENYDKEYFNFANWENTRIKEVAADPALSSYDDSELVFGDSIWVDMTYGDIERLVRLGWL